MSNQVLMMKYHPAKKEVLFQRFVSGKEVVIKRDSKLSKYMDQRGKFILQDHGNKFFEDIADTFDGERIVHIDLVTTNNDYEDFIQMIEHYNEVGSVKIFAKLKSELPDMNETFQIVKDYGSKAITILKEHQTTFFSLPSENHDVKECIDMFASEIDIEVKNICSKLESMGDNLVNLCFAGVYSAGKSALINAILGFQILPENINSSTAKMFKIESPNPNEGIRIIFDINDESAELRWNSESNSFDFKEAPNENSTRKSIQNTINLNKLEKQHRQINEVLKTLNSLCDVDSEIKIFFPIPLDNENVKFVIIDTPGTDSNYGEHQTVLQNALSDQTHSILIFVAAPNKTEGEGNSALLSYLKIAEKKDSKTSIDIGRSLFVMNWADSIDASSRMDLQKAIIKDRTDEDFSIDLSNKKLFFTSAKVGYAAKSKMNGIHTKGDDYIIRIHGGTISDAEFGRFFQQNRCATSEYATAKMIEQSTCALENAEKHSDELEVLHVCSGLYALENEISLFGKKYAAAVRAYAIINSVNRTLSKLNMTAKSLEQTNAEAIDRINYEIENIRTEIVTSIKREKEKYPYIENEFIPQQLRNSLQIDKDAIHELVENKILKEVDKILGGRITVTINKDNQRDSRKARINSLVKTVLSQYAASHLKMRNNVLESIRDAIIFDIKSIIQNNTQISSEAKNYIMRINKPEISSLDMLSKFEEIYESNRYTFKLLIIQAEYVDKEKFLSEARDNVNEIVERMVIKYTKDFTRTLKALYTAIESEFIDNTDKYSCLLQAKISDRDAMETLRDMISDAADNLAVCQNDLDRMIWSVKEYV